MQMNKNLTVSILAILIICSGIFFIVGVNIFKTPNPLDVIDLFAGKSLSFNEIEIVETIDYFISVNDDADDTGGIFALSDSIYYPNAEKDSTVSYTVNIDGINKNNKPVFIDSIEIYNSSQLLFCMNNIATRLGGKEKYHLSIDLSHGGFYHTSNRFINSPLRDSIARLLFINQSVKCKIFTSRWIYHLTPSKYTIDSRK